MTYSGITIGVAAVAKEAIFGTVNQQSFVQDDAFLVPANKQRSFFI